MKRSGLSRTIVAIAMMLIGWLPSLAHDFEVDGVFYNKTSDNTVAVTYEGDYYSYSDEYEGNIVIPSSVDYNGTTYSVTNIGDEAFSGCWNLTSIEIPNSVTSIGDEAFSGGCFSLTSIEIPNSVTSIGDEAFKNCESLTSIKIPNSVTSIGERAFAWCSSLTSIVIGNSVTSIGDSAFECCESLTSIEIPISVTSIGDSAFDGCESLTSIEIPNSVTSIGSRAFRSCSSLTSIEIPNSVTSIGNGAFSYCSSLTSIVVDADNSIYDSRNDCNAIIETASNTLIAGCKNTIIPNSVISIGEYAFTYCLSLTSIEIPNSVTSIGWCAFLDCESLTKVTCLATNPPTIKSDAFNSYSADLYVPAGCKAAYEVADYWKNFSNIIELEPELEEEMAFEYGGLTYKVTVKGKELAVIASESGEYSGAVVIPSSVDYNSTTYSVTSIGDKAFYWCESLTSIEIPNSVTSIGEGVFADCINLTGVEIPNSVTSIGFAAFSGCDGLTSIEIPNSVTSIGWDAFSDCSSLISIIVDARNTKYDSRNDCNAIIETASNTLIVGCQNTIIPNSVTSIGDHAFFGCLSLTSIEIPNSVTSIGNYAFNWCTLLTSIEIPNSVISIGECAFMDCSKLTSIVIGNSVTSIGDWAFYFCLSLTKITCLATNPPTIGSVTFSNYSAELYVPAGCISAYQSANYWKNFNSIIEMLPSANFLSGKTVNTYSGASERVSVEMTNEQAITAFQCDIYLPDGISVATIDGEYDINLSSRAKSSHSLSCVEQSDGSIRLLCYSMSLATFSGNAGELFDINFNISKEIEGNYQVLINNVVLTDKAQNEYKSSTTIDFNVKAYIPADVNNDGSINVTDVVTTASYILGLDTKKFIFEAADMNKDGVINVTDIVGIASIILNGGTASNVSAQRCAPNTSDVIKIEDFAAGKNQSQQVAIEMTNASDYSACQMDIRLPRGMSIAECELASAATDHMVAYRELPDGAVRVLVYSLTCRTLPDSEEGIIRLRTTTDKQFEGGEIVVENILFADRGQNEYRLYDSVANVNLATGVSATDMDCVVYAENRSIVIISPCDQQATISSVDGVSRTYSLNEGRNEIAAPQAGVYIVTLADRTFKVMVK